MTSRGLTEHPDRDNLRANFLARLEYGVDLTANTRGPRMTEQEEADSDPDPESPRGVPDQVTPTPASPRRGRGDVFRDGQDHQPLG